VAKAIPNCTAPFSEYYLAAAIFCEGSAMKNLIVLSLLSTLALGVPVANAKDPEMASSIFGMQISESIGSIPLQLQDTNGTYPVSNVATGSCKTTFSAGSQKWSVDWRTDTDFQRGNKNLLLVMTDRGPVGISGAGRADGDTAYQTHFDKAQRAMEYLWGNCS
jgi:hypothetical protein